MLFFVSDFNLLSCELGKCYTESFYIKGKNKIRILLQFLVKKSKTVSFDFSMIKTIVAPAGRPRFPAKLI